MDSPTVASGSATEPYRVSCVETHDADGVAEHRHVVSLETSSADRRLRWTAVQVIAAIRDGELFVVGEGGEGQAAVLEPAVCPRCQRATLVTHPEDALEAARHCE